MSLFDCRSTAPRLCVEFPLHKYSLGSADHEYRQIGVEVGISEDFRAGLGVESDAPMDVDIFCAAEVLEIGNGEEPNIGSVVPLVMQNTALRGPAFFGD